MRLGDPKECRERAAHCAELATTATSQIAREKFAHMAQVWLQLATQLKEEGALLDRCSETIGAVGVLRQTRRATP